MDAVIDLRNLVVIDNSQLDNKKLTNDKKSYLLSLAQINVTRIFSELCKLPIKEYEFSQLYQLPEEKIPFPRSKHLPIQKEPTKWEKFAKQKGIIKKKRDRMLWQDSEKEWKPRFGFKGINEKESTWVVEHSSAKPSRSDPFDEIDSKSNIKKENAAKNEFKRLQNISAQKNNIIMKTSESRNDPNYKKSMKTKKQIARISNASAGKFQKIIKGENKVLKTGRKLHFEPLIGDLNLERNRVLNMIERPERKKPLNIDKAARSTIAFEKNKSIGGNPDKLKNKRKRKK